MGALFDAMMAAAPEAKLEPKARSRSRAKVDRPICGCGHELAHHDAKGCSYGRGTRFGGCSCKKHHGKNEKPTIDRPDDAFDLWRPDTVRPKKMGWAVVASHIVTIYLDGLKTRSPNVSNRWAFGGAQSRGMLIGAAMANKARAERALSAVEQCKVHDRARPTKVTITRLSTGKLDDDNLAAALKFLRDGVAEALLFDDREFSIAGQDPKKVPLFYAQRSPGKRGVKGVEIQLEWGDP